MRSWKCLIPECIQTTGGTWNRYGAKSCGFCHTPKGASESQRHMDYISKQEEVQAAIAKRMKSEKEQGRSGEVQPKGRRARQRAARANVAEGQAAAAADPPPRATAQAKGTPPTAAVTSQPLSMPKQTRPSIAPWAVKDTSAMSDNGAETAAVAAGQGPTFKNLAEAFRMPENPVNGANWDPTELAEIWPALTAIIGSLADDALPGQWEERKTPEAEVDRLLGLQVPTAKHEEYAAICEEVSRLERVVENMGEKDVSDHAKGFRRLLDDAKAKKSKLAKSAPKQELRLHTIEAALKDLYGLAIARKQRVAAAKLASAQRTTARSEKVRILAEQLDMATRRISTIETMREQLYAKRAQDTEIFDQQS